jgi:hypothetical protein
MLPRRRSRRRKKKTILNCIVLETVSVDLSTSATCLHARVPYRRLTCLGGRLEGLAADRLMGY